MKRKKKPQAELRKYDKHYKVMSILLFLFAVLLLLAFISYTRKDFENADISIFELAGLLSDDPIVEAKAATTRNWLGLVGAWLSFNLFNKTVGFALLPLPLFIIAWIRYLYNGRKVSDALLKSTTVYLIITVLFAGLMGSLNAIEYFSGISKEWSGSVGQFLASVFSGLLGNIGAVVFFLICMLISVYLGSDIKLERIFLYFKESYINFKNKQSAKKAESQASEYNSKAAEIINNNINETDEKKPVDESINPLNEEISPIEYDSKSAIEKDLNFKPKPVIIINKSFPKDSTANRPNPFAVNIKKENIPVDEEITNNEIENSKKSEPIIPTFKPNFKNLEKESFTSLDDISNSTISEVKEEPEINKDIISESKPINIEISTKKVLPENPPFDEEEMIIETSEEKEITEEKLKPLTVTLNRISQEKKPVNLLGSSIIDEEINYRFPGLDLLINEVSHSSVDDAELQMNAQILQEKLETFKIYIENLSVTPGPVVTQYEFVPAAGIKISKIESLSDDLAMALKAKGIRIIAPIPGKGTIGVEIPNANPAIVRFAETIDSNKFRSSDAKLPLVLGKTISGEVHVVDLAKMPHLLIAGSTGSGKSVGINTIISSLVYKLHPSELKFVIIDPKKVELQSYSKLKYHYMAASPEVNDTIVTKPEDAVVILKAAVAEMELRYDILASVRQRNISEYNQKVKQGAYKDNKDMIHKPMPYIVVIIDELADLMLTASKEIEEPITRLAQMARAIGIHLVVATQRPSVDVITGIIKANFPARIAYLVASKIDSRTILDMQGADQLLGQGDMLCLPPGSPKPVRIQNSFISTDEVENICDFIGSQEGYSEPYYLPSLQDKNSNVEQYDPSDRDPLFEEAARLIVRHQQGSVSLIQRRLKVGYARAGRIVDELENAGIIGPFDGSKARQVLIESEADLERII